MPTTTNFFRRQDKLGSGVKINYKGNAGYGTILGGIFSLLVSLFFTVFISAQVYGWLFEPSYN